MAASVISHSGHKFHEVFQLKQGSYADLPAAKITEMMKSNSLDVSLHVSIYVYAFVVDSKVYISVAECSDSVTVERCQRHIRRERGDEEWSNTSRLKSLTIGTSNSISNLKS